MSGWASLPRVSFLLLCVLGITLVTSGFPQPHLPLRAPDGSVETNQDQWEVLFPSISLLDWSIQMMSAPNFGSAANSKAGLLGEAWLFAHQAQQADGVETRVEKGWGGGWSQGGGVEKRNMVVADDAAFREKSKLLTAMERLKWLNSYMQKLLVVNSQ